MKAILLLLYSCRCSFRKMSYDIGSQQLYRFSIGGTVSGVILAVLVPMVPLAVFILRTAGLLMLVNTISNFELAFLLAGGGSPTLACVLDDNVFADGKGDRCASIA
ncbi:MAG TPA: hypothetical protein VFR73_06300 [Hyphomicrobiaceae bacterium]|nr:hypothetical protein [Hyphomicrobiaceae bacterium]